jgi:hypothetical protein
MKPTQHLSRSIFAAICVAAAGGLFLSDAVAKQAKRKPAAQSGAALATEVAAQAATLPPAAPTYVNGSFTFSTPQALPRPALSVSVLKDQDVEPEIKVDLFGNVYVTGMHGYPGGVDLWKSTDKGATFSWLGEPDGTQDKCIATNTCIVGAGGGDDSIDVSTGGYLYISSLLPSTVTMSVSYDGGIGGAEPGQKWEVNPVSSTIPVNDRQWVAAYGPQTVYMTFDQAPVNTTIWFTKSTDAGKTWSAPSMLIPLTTLSRENNLGVDQYNGNIYTTYTPSGKPYELHLLKSTDGGGTWANSIIYSAPTSSCLENAFPILAVDRGGNIHVVFTQSTGCSARTNAHVYLISSGDGGSTWTSPLKIDSGPGNNSTVMPYIAAGSPGVVDVTWYGSSMSSPDSTPSAPDKSDWWSCYFAQVTNALQANPTIAQSVVAPAVHNRPICSRGGNCTGNTRDLSEYYSMTVDPDGNANIAYVDEANYCAAHPASNCFPHTFYTKQTSGQSALNPPAGPQPSTFSTNIPIGSPGGEPGIKVDSHNCIFVTAPGPASLWKSVNNGLSFLPKVNPVAGYARTGGDEDVLPVPLLNGARPDTLYFADLAGLAAINIAESTNGGSMWFKPGPGGAASEMDLSADRQWLAYDRNVPSAGDLTIYEMDHEAAGEAIRFSALTNDGVWSAPASGMTALELILPPGATFPNTNPGNVFANKNTHTVYGAFSASTLTNDLAAPPFGKQPNLWCASGAAPTAAGMPPGPFTDFPAFKGVIDSPAQAPSPAPSIPPSAATYGSHIGLLFPAAAIDAAGNIYAVWATNSSRANTIETGTNTPSTTFDVWMSVSHDGGQNFYGPFRISNGVGTSLMPGVTAGDAGRVEVVWYQTPNVGPPLVAAAGELQGGPDGVPANSQWNVMFAQSLNADSREPVFSVSQASDHSTHNGGICVNGTLCLLGGDRSLADFFQVAIGPDGLANIAYADNGHTSTHVEYTRQTSGPLGLTNPVPETCIPMVFPVKAVSRKVHGSVGPFDIDLTNGNGIECRSGGASNAHQVVISFANSLVGVGGVTVASGTATVQNFTVNGADVTVNLTGVTNAQRLVLDLTNVNDGTTVGDAFVAMNVLVGDTNADRFCDAVDVSQTKSQSGHTATNSPPNFREDVNADGYIDAVDTALVKSKSGTSLP